MENQFDQTNSDSSHGDFHDLSGTWVPDPDFDQITQEQRQIDPELWKTEL